MENTELFKQELKDLLTRYDASIRLTCNDFGSGGMNLYNKLNTEQEAHLVITFGQDIVFHSESMTLCSLELS